MASQQSPSGPLLHHQQQYQPAAAPGRPPQPNGAMSMPPAQQAYKPGSVQHTAAANEDTWLQLGALSELMGESDSATQAYERALSFNQWSIRAMLAISCILRSKDQYTSAVEYLRQIIKLEPNNGEVWSSLGHCYLMMDDLQQAYSAYQQALYHLPDPKEPKLWYGIGILYDRYGSLEHAEEAFSQVMRMEPGFEKANEIYFRLGIIYKQQQKFQQSLECFRYIVNDPPRPLSEEDIWFQIGHVHEQQKDYDSAKAAYTRVLERDPHHAKVLQQLGWLHHQQSASFSSQEQAIEYLEKSVSSDQTDAQSWYLLGRCYMSQQKYPKAYEAYQQAVYRDGRNPTFWCSIGVLYYQINQYRDALDAYSRAIRLNPNISEVWYDLGTLYESCNNQTSDALDAYTRAADLDPTNVHIKARLALLKGQSTNGLPTQAAPLPQDVHPQAYQPGAHGPPGPQWGAHAQNPPPPGPAPPPLSGGSWTQNRLADLQNPQMPPQPMNPFEQRDRLPPQQQSAVQPPQPPMRQPSPRPEPPRYQDQPQRQPPPAHRGLSPSPKGQHTAPYPSSATNHQNGPPPPAEMPRHGFGAPLSGGPSSNGLPGPPQHASMPPYVRPGEQSLGSESRQLSTPTPVSGPGHYGRGPYEHHANSSISSHANNGPSLAALQGPTSDPGSRDRDDRPGSAVPIKRHREWEEESSVMGPKKPQTEESRSRLDEIKMHRHSPSEKMATPPHSSPSDLRRMDEVRPPSTYHPSEAAHHPPSLPSVHNMTQRSPRSSAPPQDDRNGPPPPPQQLAPVNMQTHARQASRPPSPPQQSQPQPQAGQATTQSTAPVYEPAARKIEIDESYDTDDDKSAKSTTKQESRKNSPKPNGTATAAAATTSAGGNDA